MKSEFERVMIETNKKIEKIVERLFGIANAYIHDDKDREWFFTDWLMEDVDAVEGSYFDGKTKVNYLDITKEFKYEYITIIVTYKYPMGFYHIDFEIDYKTENYYAEYGFRFASICEDFFPANKDKDILYHIAHKIYTIQEQKKRMDYMIKAHKMKRLPDEA